MRHILISSLLVLGTAGIASASERYPTTQRYVNQSGQVVSVERTLTMRPVANATAHAVLPPVRMVPISPNVASQTHQTPTQFEVIQPHGPDNNHDSVNYDSMNRDSKPFGAQTHFRDRMRELRDTHECCSQTALSHDTDIYDAGLTDE